MPDKYVPKHRDAPPRRVRAGAKNAVYASGVAFFATGLSVSAGMSGHAGAADSGTLINLAAGKTQLTAADLAAREQSASRSVERRISVDPLKTAAFTEGAGAAVTKSEDLTATDPKTLTRALMAQYGMSSSQFNCIDDIWSQESGWNVHAANPSSSAYGIPQALPGSKMATAGPDWQNNAETQIRWGLSYIEKRYGTACSAWSFKQSHGWY